MEPKKLKRLVKLAFVFLNLSCIAGIAGFFLEIFSIPHTKLYTLFHLSGMKEVLVAFPVKPVIGLIVTISLFMVFSRLLYKSVCSKIV